MNRMIKVGLVALALVALLAPVANAYVSCSVRYQSAFWGYAAADVRVVDSEGNTYDPGSYVGVGAQKAKISIDGGALELHSSPLYCLDLFHWQGIFDGLRYTVPPENHPEPPYNTTQAAWVYHNYGKVRANQKAVQLALWEVTHEADWFSAYNRADWYAPHGTTGNGPDEFYLVDISGGFTGAIIEDASDILDDLHFALSQGPLTIDRSCYYYRPGVRTDEIGQGLIGDVPEPSSLLLIGGALLGVAGMAWRKRSQS